MNYPAQLQTRTARLIIAASVSLLYIIFFIILHPYFGSAVAALSVIPVVILAALTGTRIGILVGLLLFPLNTALLNIMGETGWDILIQVGGAPGTAAIVIVGGAVGYLHDTRHNYDRVIREVSGIAYQLESLLAALPEEIYRLNFAGEILAYHLGQETNLELGTRNLAGRQYTDAMPQNIHEALTPALLKIRLQKQPQRIEFEHIVGGELRYFEGNLLPLPNREMLLIVRDVTDTRQALQQRLMMAVQRGRIDFLSEFLSTIAHDFRTPLTVIKSNLYLFERLKDDPLKQREKVEQMKTQTDRLNKLVDDVITISRLDNDLEASMNRIRVNRVVQSAVGNLMHCAQAKNLDLTMSLNPTEVAVLGNELTLHQAIMCLVDNAVNYTDRGTITVRTVRDDGEVHILVEDTGNGIPEADLDHIFEHFYRVDKARNTATGGAGLGLSIAKRIAELHSGNITVESIEGEGSTFTLTLPLIEHHTSELFAMSTLDMLDTKTKVR